MGGSFKIQSFQTFKLDTWNFRIGKYKRKLKSEVINKIWLILGATIGESSSNESFKFLTTQARQIKVSR